jgi:hypothetical protein
LPRSSTLTAVAFRILPVGRSLTHRPRAAGTNGVIGSWALTAWIRSCRIPACFGRRLRGGAIPAEGFQDGIGGPGVGVRLAVVPPDQGVDLAFPFRRAGIAVAAVLAFGLGLLDRRERNWGEKEIRSRVGVRFIRQGRIMKESCLRSLPRELASCFRGVKPVPTCVGNFYRSNGPGFG